MSSLVDYELSDNENLLDNHLSNEEEERGNEIDSSSGEKLLKRKEIDNLDKEAK